MTAYQQKSFSVLAPGTQQYRDNWDTIFGKKEEPLVDTWAKAIREAVDTLVQLDSMPVEEKAFVDTYHSGDRIPRVEIETRNPPGNNVAKRTREVFERLAKQSRIDPSYADGPSAEQAHSIARNSTELRKQVVEFKQAVGQPVHYAPRLPAKERVQFCLRLIAEEFLELLEASGCKVKGSWLEDDVEEAIVDIDMKYFDLPSAIDACGDIDYCVEGLRDECGVNGKPIADAIHTANMSKLGEDGKPILNPQTGKTMKGPNYVAPDVAKELRLQGWKR